MLYLFVAWLLAVFVMKQGSNLLPVQSTTPLFQLSGCHFCFAVCLLSSALLSYRSPLRIGERLSNGWLARALMLVIHFARQNVNLERLLVSLIRLVLLLLGAYASLLKHYSTRRSSSSPHSMPIILNNFASGVDRVVLLVFWSMRCVGLTRTAGLELSGLCKLSTIWLGGLSICWRLDGRILYLALPFSVTTEALLPVQGSSSTSNFNALACLFECLDLVSVQSASQGPHSRSSLAWDTSDVESRHLLHLGLCWVRLFVS